MSLNFNILRIDSFEKLFGSTKKLGKKSRSNFAWATESSQIFTPQTNQLLKVIEIYGVWKFHSTIENNEWKLPQLLISPTSPPWGSPEWNFQTFHFSHCVRFCCCEFPLDSKWKATRVRQRKSNITGIWNFFFQKSQTFKNFREFPSNSIKYTTKEIWNINFSFILGKSEKRNEKRNWKLKNIFNV